MRESARALINRDADGHTRTRSESEVVLQEIITLAKKHGELYPMMMEILNRCGQILQRDIGMYVHTFLFFLFSFDMCCRQLKADLFVILDRFVEQAAFLDSLYASSPPYARILELHLPLMQ